MQNDNFFSLSGLKNRCLLPIIEYLMACSSENKLIRTAHTNILSRDKMQMNIYHLMLLYKKFKTCKTVHLGENMK